MKRSFQATFAVFAITMLLGTALALAAPGTAPRPFAPVQQGFTTRAAASLPYAPDRLLVQLTPKAMAGVKIGSQRGDRPQGGVLGLPSLDALAAQAGVVSIERPYHPAKDAAKAAAVGKDRWLMFRFDAPDDLPALAEAFGADGNVAQVSLDWRAYPAVVPNDPLYADQWGHNNTGQMPSYDWGSFSHTGPLVGTPGFDSHAEEAWAGSQGYGAGVVIAILDTGADVGHPDLNLVSGYDFGDNDPNPQDDSAYPGHGTACSGIAAAVADNNEGVAGVAGAAGIMACKVADSAGYLYFSYIADALYWAADNGADVASMSFGADITSDPATDAALLYAYDAGVTLFAATGNANASTISYPAINQYVIAVGAASPCGDRKRSSSTWWEVNPGVNTDPNGYTCDGERWWGSSYGVATPDAAGAVDLIAPTIMPTTDIRGGAGFSTGDYEMFFNGTSCSTPYAAGCAALVIAANPTFTPAQVRAALTSTATDVVNVESGAGWDRYSGYGMVNVDAALNGGGGGTLELTLVPQGAPIQIPAAGGAFTYDVSLVTDHQITVTAQFDAILPSGAVYPVFTSPTMTLTAGSYQWSNLMQDVPGSAPAGTYTYRCIITTTGGETAQDAFTFEKTTVKAVGSGADDWDLIGWEQQEGSDAAPAGFALKGAAPNPFNPMTTISFDLPRSERVSLDIFDITGRRVRSLIRGETLEAGSRAVIWNGRDESGRQAATGVYFYRLRAGEFTDTGRMLMIK